MVPYTHATLDKPRLLRIDFRGLHELKSLCGISVDDLTKLEENIDPEIIVKVLWVAMRSNDRQMSLENAWEIVNNLGDNVVDIMTKAAKIMSEVVRDSFGIKDDDEDKEKNL